MTQPVIEATRHLAALLARSRFRQGREDKLHDDLGRHLRLRSYDFEREVVLDRDNRIDFLVEGGIGIECKARAHKRDTFRQLERYAGFDAIETLILLSGTAIGLPPEIAGKPVFFVSLGRASL